MLTGTRRTVLMLAGCQALSMTGGSIVGLTGAIVGNMLTPDKALSTLPIAVQQAGVMAATIPAALLMARIGRRPGFWLGTAIGGIGAVIATWAIFRSSFEWFCVGTFLLGANRGATQQYRFAAAEIADDAFRSKAISRNGRPPPTNAGVAGRGNSTKYSRTAEARNSTRISA